MKRIILQLVLATGVLAGGAASALAQPAELLGDHTAWSAYAAEDGSGRICFAMSAPSATTPQPAGLGEAHLYVTHRVAANVRSEVNLVSGYVFAANSPATATVGNQSFALATAGDGAWLADPSQSPALVSAMRAGSTMSITGTSEAGQQITQTFSLMGITAATNQIDSAC